MNKILKSVLGTVLTIDEDDNTKTPTVTTSKNVEQSNFVASSNVEYHPLNNVYTGDTQKYKEHFLQLLKDTNLPGNDYYELNMSLDALVAAIPDERTRFIAAYTPLAIQGLTKDKVNSTAKAYLSALDQDAANFNNSLEQKRNQDVDGQKQQVNTNNQKIQDLTSQIQKLNSDNNSITQKISESEGKISASKTGYDVELNNIKNKINNDLMKINTYIN